MSSSPLRLGLIIALSTVLLIAVMVASIPLLVSTSLIRDRLAAELSDAIGYRIILREAPEISVFPRLNATLRGISVSDWSDASARPVMDADAVSVDLHVGAALRGRLSFSALSLIRPVLHADALAQLSRKQILGFSPLSRYIEQTRALLAENPAEPDFSRLPAASLGKLTVIDGRAELPAAEDGESASIEDINGLIEWPGTARPASVSGGGTWNGEAVRVSVSVNRPLVLMAGGMSALKLDITAKPLTLRFDGAANLSDQPFAEGQVAAATPSLSSLLSWAELDVGPGSAVGSLAIGGDISGDPQRFRLAKASVSIDDNPGSGALEFSLADAKPQVSGSLDFNRIDLAALLSAFIPLPTGAGLYQSVDTTFINQLGLDVRLSADTASAGALMLTNVAASAQIKAGIASFDVNDADLYSGTMQAGLKIDARKAEPKGELRLSIENMATGEFGAGVGMKRAVPQFPGQLSILARGPFESWRSMIDNSTGTFLYRGGAGRLAGLDWNTFVERTRGHEVFPLWSVPQGDVAVQSSELQGRLEQGTLRLDKGIVKIGDQALTLSGVLPYADRSLAMLGTVSPLEDEGAAGKRSFFIGGSWANPFITPILAPFGGN
ncbi:MAG: AsmA family protein [Brucellaceae bacterium]|nr:AsmA family protein [Brucellaceae bacterium]